MPSRFKFIPELQYIQDAKTNAIGKVTLKDKSYGVNLVNPGNLKNEKQKEGLEKRMVDWYVFTQIVDK